MRIQNIFASACNKNNRTLRKEALGGILSELEEQRACFEVYRKDIEAQRTAYEIDDAKYQTQRKYSSENLGLPVKDGDPVIIPDADGLFKKHYFKPDIDQYRPRPLNIQALCDHEMSIVRLLMSCPTKSEAAVTITSQFYSNIARKSCNAILNTVAKRVQPHFQRDLYISESLYQTAMASVALKLECSGFIGEQKARAVEILSDERASMTLRRLTSFLR